MKFEPGQVVQLVSGGPPMAVQHYDDGGPFYGTKGWCCSWFCSQGTARSQTFPEAVLQPWPADVPISKPPPAALAPQPEAAPKASPAPKRRRGP